MNFVTFNLIIDDLVFPDGSTQMAVLGGGGPQTAFGMRLWSKSVGIVSGVGKDLTPEHLDWFQVSDIDVYGLRQTDLPTPRAWQIMEANGDRTQVWRVPQPVISAQLGRRISHLPEAYRNVDGFHLGIHPEEPDLDFLYALKELGAPGQNPLISVEPFRPANHPLAVSDLRSLLAAVDIFSPNREEALSILGHEGIDDPMDVVKRLFDFGAQVVTLRLGSGGSLVAQREPFEAYRIPAVEVIVVDPVGAGNAYCGGFLAGMKYPGVGVFPGLESDEPTLLRAGKFGAVAASFLVEQVGVPPATNEIRQQALIRLRELREE